MTSHGNEPKPSVFGYFKDKIQTLMGKRESSQNLQTVKNTPFNSEKISTIQNILENQTSSLACPRLPLFYSKILYHQSQTAMDILLKQSIIAGILGELSNAEFFKNNYLIRFQQQFKINNLSNFRQKAFDFIFFNWREKRYYKDLLRSSQLLITLLKTDEELKQFVQCWQSIISEQMRRQDCLLNEIANKLILQIFTINNQYYILINKQENAKPYEELQCILKQNNISDLKQIVQKTITLRQYFELRQIFYQTKNLFDSESLIKYLSQRNQYFENQYYKFINKVEEEVPFEIDDIQSLTSQEKISNQRDCTLSHPELFIQQDLGNVIIIKKGTEQSNGLNFLYNINRYEGIDDQENRSLQEPERIRKYRTKSCSLYGQQYQDDSTDSIEQEFDFD